MPKAYTQYELIKTYEEIALERRRVCSGCGGKERLSHSHLIPRSRRGDLATNKENIRYHCLGASHGAGCHEKYEGVLCATLNDFKDNFKIIHKLDRQYFWIRTHKLIDYWTNNSLKWPGTLDKIKSLCQEIEQLEKVNAFNGQE